MPRPTPKNLLRDLYTVILRGVTEDSASVSSCARSSREDASWSKKKRRVASATKWRKMSAKI